MRRPTGEIIWPPAILWIIILKKTNCRGDWLYALQSNFDNAYEKRPQINPAFGLVTGKLLFCRWPTLRLQRHVAGYNNVAFLKATSWVTYRLDLAGI